MKIAITGGPSGGKTTLLETLTKNMGKKIAVVPEAATILYKGGFPRKKSIPSIQKTQLAIYHTQKQLEDIISTEHSANVVICDRGSLDGLAYWPGDSQDFLNQLATTLVAETSRYDWVLHLDTASADFYDSESTIRTETPDEAMRLNERVRTAWQSHPKRIIVPHHDDFIVKMALCMNIIKMIISNEAYSEINTFIAAALKQVR